MHPDPMLRADGTSPTTAQPMLGSPYQYDELMPLDVGPVSFARPDALATSVLPERPPYLPEGVTPPLPIERTTRTSGPDGPPLDWPLYDHPVLAQPDPELEPDPHNRLIGLFIVAAAVVVTAASLLPWVTFDGGPVAGDSSGWHRGEGVVTVVAGIVLAGAGGAIAGGAKRLWIKLVAMAAAVCVILVFAVDVVDISMEAEDLVGDGLPVDLDQGYGLWMVGAAGITAFVLTLVEHTPWSRRS